MRCEMDAKCCRSTERRYKWCDITKDIGIYEKEMFMRFFEELYLQIKAGHLNREDVYHLFAYYALKYNKYLDFRKNIEDYKSKEELPANEKDAKEYDNWTNFRCFVEEMTKQEEIETKK